MRVRVWCGWGVWVRLGVSLKVGGESQGVA